MDKDIAWACTRRGEGESWNSTLPFPPPLPPTIECVLGGVFFSWSDGSYKRRNETTWKYVIQYTLIGGVQLFFHWRKMCIAIPTPHSSQLCNRQKWFYTIFSVQNTHRYNFRISILGGGQLLINSWTGFRPILAYSTEFQGNHEGLGLYLTIWCPKTTNIMSLYTGREM